MKKTNFTAVLKATATVLCGLLIMTALPSCNKDSASTTTTTDTVTEAVAAQAVTQAVEPTSGGMAQQTTEAAVVASNQTAYPCGGTFDSSIVAASVAGAAISYSVDLQWNWVLSCSTASFTFGFTGHTTYAGSLISSNDSSNGGFVVTGLAESAPNYVLSSNYVRNGSQQSYIGNKNSFTSVINISSSNINIDKTTEEILSGTATASISGSSTSGKSFSYSGTINFLGNQAATLTMASGNVYQISW